MKTVMLAILSLTAASLSGCISWLYTPGMSDLHELCEKDGGTHIQQVVELEGYYNDGWSNCSGCYSDITDRGYEYLEINKRKRDYGLLGEEMGYWRIYRARAGDPNCPIKENERIAAKFWKPINDFYASGNCLAAIKVDRLQSEYGYYIDEQEWVVNDYYGSQMIRQIQEIRRFSTQEVVATKINYKLVPWPRSALDYGVKATCVGILPRERTNKPLIQPKGSIKIKGLTRD